jgi:signal peptidase I
MPGPSKSRFSVFDAFLIALILAILVKLTLFTTFKVEGDSMLPTLRPGDLILCVKPVLFSLPAWDNGEKAFLMRKNLKRGDIVVFKPATFPDTEYVKRVIAVPGENMTILAGKVKINAGLLKEPYLSTDSKGNTGEDISFHTPDGYVFVMGDNRPHSQDSRTIGPVAVSNIEGKCVAVYKPLKHFRLFSPW